MLFNFFTFIGGDDEEEINMMNEWMNECGEWIIWWMNEWMNVVNESYDEWVNEWMWWTLIEAKNMDECGEGRVPSWRFSNNHRYLPTYLPTLLMTKSPLRVWPMGIQSHDHCIVGANQLRLNCDCSTASTVLSLVKLCNPTSFFLSSFLVSYHQIYNRKPKIILEPFLIILGWFFPFLKEPLVLVLTPKLIN
jgi:hypothetical protein